MPPIPLEQQSPFGGNTYDPETAPVLVTTRHVLARYGGIHETTLWRWLRDGVFPPPDKRINGRRYWWTTTLDAFDDREAA